jgi:hypothetical protein
MKYPTIAGAAVVLLGLAGCTGSGGSSSSDGPASYLAAGNSRVAFIHWRAASHGQLRGTITYHNAGGSAPAEKMAVSSAPFTGSIKGSSVRLRFEALYFLHTGASGTLSGGRLTLRLPGSDGAIQQMTFSQSDVTSYRSAIAALGRTVVHANQQAAQLQGQQAQPAKAQVEQGAQSSLRALYNDSSLAAGGKLSTGVARFADDIQTARSDLATQKHDAAGVKSYCRAAFTVSGDAQSVDGDVAAVQGDAKTLTADVSTVRLDTATAEADLRKLAKAGLPAPHSAGTLISGAKANLKQAIAAGNSYIDQVNAIDARSHAIANKMTTGSCSGAKSGNSTMPVSHIK